MYCAIKLIRIQPNICYENICVVKFLHNVKMKKHVSTNEMAAFNIVHVSKYLSLIMIINFSVLWQTFPRPRSMQLKLGNRNWWIFHMSRVVGYSLKHNNNLSTNFMVCRGPTLQLSTCTFNRLMQSIFKILIFKITYNLAYNLMLRLLLDSSYIVALLFSNYHMLSNHLFILTF